jgi:uncharacterized membrane protein YkvA (DUF1232 family)
MKAFIQKFRTRTDALKSEMHALYLAWQDARTPWAAKVLLFLVLAYALSPIDLIPDVIPIFGYLDDLVIVPAGLALAIKMIPPEVLSDARRTAMQHQDQFSVLGKFGTAIIILLWILVAVMIIWQLHPLVGKISR